ncbi:hypothetical protein D9M71_490710 [compost metagenome]
MHRQAFKHFKKEETGERQDDEQQCVFDRAVAFQVLVHRVDEAHAKTATGQRLASTTGHAAVEDLLQIGGEKRSLPIGGEA